MWCIHSTDITTCLLFDPQVDDTLACNITNYLRDSSVRDSKNEVTKPFICDELSPGWYRFEKGEIATRCVPGFHCSKSTIWMDDTIPSVQEGLQVKKFCVNFVIDAGDSNCCDWSYNIKVKNCGNFLTYYLGTDLMTCPMAYCTSDIKPCEPGTTSASGFEPCKEHLPENLNPQLHGPLVTSSDFQFECEFTYLTTRPTIIFNVTWRFNDIPVTYEIVQASSKQKSVSSNHSLWEGHIGEKLSCSVQPISSNGSRKTIGTEEKSGEYFGGIQIEPKDILVTEGTETELIITSTLPVLCEDTDVDNCSLQLEVIIDANEGSKAEALLSDRCNISLLKEKLSSNASTTLRLSLPLNPAVYHDDKHSVKVEITPGSGVHAMWNGYSPQSPVKTQNAPHAECLLFPNGHIIGFAKTDLYTMNYPGDYLVYETPKDADTTLVVHARHKVLSKQLSSMCGVAMQYGPDIVYLDMCEYDSVPIITMNNTDNKLTIYECGPHEYHVYASDDVRLEVQLYDHDIAVKLHLSPGYSNKGQGLCSFVHPTGNTVLLLDDIKAYRLKPTDSYFGSGKRKNFSFTKSSQESFCNCKSALSDCSPSLRVTDAVNQKFRNCTVISVVSVDIRSHGINKISNINSFYPRPFSWLTPSGRTEQNTRQECQSNITSYVPRICLTEVGPFQSKFNEICLNDVKLTDSFDNRLAIIQAYTWLCQAIALAKPSNYKNSVIPLPAVTSELCPRFCSLNGTCRNGVCNCYFSKTVDCSVPDGAIEKLVGILGGLTCIGVSGGCLKPTILSQLPLTGIIDNLYAQVTPFYFDAGKREPLKEHGDISLPINKEYEYGFSLDLSAHSIISLFTDQTAYGFSIFILTGSGLSNILEYVIYDDKCRRCYSDQVVMCTIKEKSCHIDDKCYGMGEVNPKDSTQKCDPTKSFLYWSST